MAPNPAAALAIVIEGAVQLAPYEVLRERLRPGERLVYGGRLTPLAAPGAGVAGDLATALAEIPDRRSRIARGGGGR